MKSIDNLYTAKEALKAYKNYNLCDKHCELPNTEYRKIICCCHRPCMSKNNEPNNYTQDNIMGAIDYILNYMSKISREMRD